MLFSYNWLQSFFNKKLPEPKKLAELLTLYSFEVKEVKRKGKDWVFDIEVYPNRADCFSHLGIARECFAILKPQIPNLKLKVPGPKLKEDKKTKIKDLVGVEVKDKKDCPRYTGRVILGVKIAPSPAWLQKRLISCGLKPINNVVDATNYVMLEIGQPLHAFDLEKIEGKIIVRRAKDGEKIEALDDKTYILNRDVLVIADEKKPLAIAGIKGGKSAEILPQTKNIFIEGANFDPVLIRKASRKLKIRTDASFRFEHGLDPNMTEIAIDRAAQLIQEIAGGEIVKGKIDFYPKKVFPKKITLNLERLNRIAGIEIKKIETKKILERLGLEVLKSKEKNLIVKIPTQRKDLNIEEDLIEEVTRIYGYKKVLPKAPRTEVVLPEKNFEILVERKIKETAKELGFVEVYNYSFISAKDAKLWKENLVELKNPISEEFQYLRPTLLINLIKNVEKNLKYFDEFKLFEIGKVFGWKKEKLIEKRMFSGVLVAKRDEGFYILKGYVDSLLKGLGIDNYFYDSWKQVPENTKEFFWHINKSAEIKVDGKKIGFLGEISERVLDFYKIKKPLFAFDIDFEKLGKFITEEREYQEIPKYPATIRDIAILVPISTLVDQVQRVIFDAGSKLLVDVDLFDIYFGKELPEGKKNLAFHLIFQAKDRTLSSKEVDKLMEKIIKALEENPEWEVRK